MNGTNGNDALYESSIDFLPPSNTHDLISDFDHDSDRIDLLGLDANDDGKGNGDFIWLAKEGAKFTGVAGQLAFDQHGKLTTVMGDIDGEGRRFLYRSLWQDRPDQR
jgi:hypothetical protein